MTERDYMEGFTPRVSPEELTSFGEDMDILLERGTRLLDGVSADYEDLVVRIGVALNEDTLTKEEVRKLRECRLHFLEKQNAIDMMKSGLLKNKNAYQLNVGR